LGVKEINAYLKGQISGEQAKQLLKRNTRRYAKRQMTWFRKNAMIQWLGNKGALANILKLVKLY
jgi:tRNA dimethylallyltransferase